MIENLTELLKFSAEVERDLSAPYETALRRVVAGEPDTGRLARLKLPSSYVDFVSRYHVQGVSLGYCELSVGDSTAPLVDELLRVNSQPNSPINWFGVKTLAVVGSAQECYQICVQNTDGDKPGVVMAMDIEFPEPPSTLREVASSFEEFALLAGNLAQLARLDLPGQALGAEMELRLRKLGTKPEHWAFWVGLAA